eukprot:6035894-Prymnesium_polylepis.1
MDPQTPPAPPSQLLARMLRLRPLWAMSCPQCKERGYLTQCNECGRANSVHMDVMGGRTPITCLNSNLMSLTLCVGTPYKNANFYKETLGRGPKLGYKSFTPPPAQRGWLSLAHPQLIIGYKSSKIS